MTKKITKKRMRGFTLIELLVVISIIGLLSSIILTGMSVALAKARDTKRLRELKSLQNALELYRTSNGTYPATPPPAEGNNDCNWTDYGSGISGFRGMLMVLEGGSGNVKYISKIPGDPFQQNPNSGNITNCYTYYRDEDETGAFCGEKEHHGYMLLFRTESAHFSLPVYTDSGGTLYNEANGYENWYCLSP